MATSSPLRNRMLPVWRVAPGGTGESLRPRRRDRGDGGRSWWNRGSTRPAGVVFPRRSRRIRFRFLVPLPWGDAFNRRRQVREAGFEAPVLLNQGRPGLDLG